MKAALKKVLAAAAFVAVLVPAGAHAAAAPAESGATLEQIRAELEDAKAALAVAERELADNQHLKRVHREKYEEAQAAGQREKAAQEKELMHQAMDKAASAQLALIRLQATMASLTKQAERLGKGAGEGPKADGASDGAAPRTEVAEGEAPKTDGSKPEASKPGPERPKGDKPESKAEVAKADPAPKTGEAPKADGPKDAAKPDQAPAKADDAKVAEGEAPKPHHHHRSGARRASR